MEFELKYVGPSAIATPEGHKTKDQPFKAHVDWIFPERFHMLLMTQGARLDLVDPERVREVIWTGERAIQGPDGELCYPYEPIEATDLWLARMVRKIRDRHLVLVEDYVEQVLSLDDKEALVAQRRRQLDPRVDDEGEELPWTPDRARVALLEGIADIQLPDKDGDDQDDSGESEPAPEDTELSEEDAEALAQDLREVLDRDNYHEMCGKYEELTGEKVRNKLGKDEVVEKIEGLIELVEA